ncbi:MAG TPA: hypothetical protein ACFCUC_11330, partial [Desulfobacterales bacterium]
FQHLQHGAVFFNLDFFSVDGDGDHRFTPVYARGRAVGRRPDFAARGSMDSCPNRVRLQVQHRSPTVLLSFITSGECRRKKIQATRFAGGFESKAPVRGRPPARHRQDQS